MKGRIQIGKCMTIGSCFSDEIGKRMKGAGYDICINPFGVQFNPASIANSLKRLLSGEEFNSDDVILRDPYYGSKKGRKGSTPKKPSYQQESSPHRSIAPSPFEYTSFYHHGSFTEATPELFLKRANTALRTAQKHFIASDTILVTFGTPYLFFHKERGIIVSNCHKHLGSEFSREGLNEEEIVNLFRPIIAQAEGKQWVFTVSPVRHLGEGEEENIRSKTTLINAAKRLCKESKNAVYFPAYEIVTEELANTVNYAEDGRHPSFEAIEYVWKKFQAFAVNKEAG